METRYQSFIYSYEKNSYVHPLIDIKFYYGILDTYN